MNKENVSLFQQAVNSIKLLFTPKRYRQTKLVSRFKIALDALDKNSREYTLAAGVVELCEEALRITRQRILNNEKIRIATDKMEEVACFQALTEDETKALQHLLNHYISLSKERTALMHQITGFDASLSRVMEMEEDAESTVSTLAEAEEYRRVLKQDLGYLGGEKTELEYERERLERHSEFIRRFSIFMVSIFAVCTIVFSFMFIFNDAQVFRPFAIMAVCLMLVVFIIYIFKRRLNYELAYNLKKQQKAVEMLNKKTAVFAHYSNYLDYVYRKYRVRNSAMLRKNLKDVKTYKHLTGRIDSIRNIMYQTQDMIEDFLRKKNINHLSTSVEHFAKTINVLDKKAYYNELSDEKERYEHILTKLDDRHGEIWDILMEARDEDPSKERVIDSIIDIYLEEAERIVIPS